jgi:release factor glutamine methyltransferase
MISAQTASAPLPTHSALTLQLRSAGCVFAEEEASLLLSEAGTVADLERMVAQRVEGFPLEYVLGWAAFHGLRIAVEPGVFVPRRRTEYLVQQGARFAEPGSAVVDLCCGSGAVGAALAAAVPGIELHAADIDPAAVRCARRNVEAVGGRVHEGDLYAALPPSLRGRIGLLLVNAPYVPTADIETMPQEARLHEARTALDGGADGLAVQRRTVSEAPLWLAPGGRLLIETSARQAPLTAALFEAAGLSSRVLHSEELDATVVLGSTAESAPKDHN